MTVSSELNKISYNGNGSTTQFATPYFLQNDHIVVVLRDDEDVETTLTITAHYTLSGSGDEDGGTCTMLTAPATGERLVIYRDPPLTQTVEYNDQDEFPATTTNRALDKGIMIDQRLHDLLSRTLRLKESDTVGSGTFQAGGQRIVDVDDGVDGGDAVNYAQLQAVLALLQTIMPTDVAILQSRTAATLAEIDATIKGLRTNGYDVGGDGGHGTYKRIDPNNVPAYTGAARFRSLDRYMPGGSEDLTDGGWWELADPIPSALQFGAIADNSTDNTDALQDFFDWVAMKEHGKGIIPGGNDWYKIDGTVTIDGNVALYAEKRVSVEAYGAVFNGRSSTNPFKITGFGAGNFFTWYGGVLHVDNSVTPTVGLLLEQTSDTHVIDFTVMGGAADGSGLMNAGFAGIRIKQADLMDESTGSFWNLIERCMVLSDPNAAADTTVWVPDGIQTQGAANALQIVNCQFERCIRSIGMFPDSQSNPDGYMANGVVIDRNTFEVVQYGVYVEGLNTSNAPGGLRITNNRFEAVAQSCFLMTQTIANNVFLTPPYLAGNMIDSACSRYIHNTNNRRVQSLDLFGQLQGTKAFSAATTAAVTFDSVGGLDMWDDQYHVFLDAPENLTLWVTNKTDSGFTINSSSSTSVTVGWHVVPYA